MVSSFLIHIIVLAACFQKTGGFALYWPLTHAKFACDWWPVVYKLYPRTKTRKGTIMETCTRTGIRVGTWTELGTKWKKYRETTRDKDRGIGGTRSVEL
jgi:hypothetical protein